jgi:hypothetical protein
MTKWEASWRPAQGDRVRSARIGLSGKIVDVKLGTFLVAYDELIGSDFDALDWHRRDDLEPIDETADRLLREYELRAVPGRHS